MEIRGNEHAGHFCTSQVAHHTSFKCTGGVILLKCNWTSLTSTSLQLFMFMTKMEAQLFDIQHILVRKYIPDYFYLFNNKKNNFYTKGVSIIYNFPHFIRSL